MTRTWSPMYKLVPIVVLAVVAGTVTSGTADAAAAADTGLVLGYGFERISAGVAADSSPSGLGGQLLGSPVCPARPRASAGTARR